MAPRLTVIVSQSARREGRLVDIEESLVTELMFAAGMDATLVGPLENIQLDSTDHLCLSGFQHSVAIVSWLDEPAAREHWQRLGLVGNLRQVGAMPPTERANEPSILYFQLTHDSSVSTLIERLKELLRDRSVKTVGLALPEMGGSLRSLPKSVRPADTVDGMVTPNIVSSSASVRTPNAAEDSLPAAKDESQSVSIAQGVGASIGGEQQNEDDWDNLDQLVDDLDALDL